MLPIFYRGMARPRGDLASPAPRSPLGMILGAASASARHTKAKPQIYGPKQTVERVITGHWRKQGRRERRGGRKEGLSARKERCRKDEVKESKESEENRW